MHHQSYHGSLRCQGSIQDAKVVLSAEDVSTIKLFVLQMSLFLFEVLLMFSNVYISIQNHPKHCSELADSSSLGISSPHEDWFAKWCINILLIANPDLASACTLDPDLEIGRAHV